MTTTRPSEDISSTPEIPDKYIQATPANPPDDAAACSSAIEAADIPLQNTVIANSKTKERSVTVNPIRIKESLETLQHNCDLREKGLG